MVSDAQHGRRRHPEGPSRHAIPSPKITENRRGQSSSGLGASPLRRAIRPFLRRSPAATLVTAQRPPFEHAAAANHKANVEAGPALHHRCHHRATRNGGQAQRPPKGSTQGHHSHAHLRGVLRVCAVLFVRTRLRPSDRTTAEYPAQPAAGARGLPRETLGDHCPFATASFPAIARAGATVNQPVLEPSPKSPKHCII